ncbi:HD domain-containing protein [Marinicella sp. W31]|uniref:HD domain-containing protein n=1 Tax=Marinicella sp. W31 TaxID=3023713 RepID=UPI00375640F5
MKKYPIGTLDWLNQNQGKLSTFERLQQIFLGVKTKANRLFKGKHLTQVSHLHLDDIKPPDSAICAAAETLAQSAQQPYLYNHCMRSYFWARLLNGKHTFDHEAFYVAILMHDLGLTEDHRLPDDSDQQCFTYPAAVMAENLALEHDWPDNRARLVADAIALHLNVSVDAKHGREAQLVRMGSGADVIGQRLLAVPKEQRLSVTKRYPRLDFKRMIIRDLQAATVNKPCCRMSLLSKTLQFEQLIRGAPFDA